MSNLPAFGIYAAAFEACLEHNDWSQLEQYFSENARYLPGDGTEAVGRAAAIDALEASVDTLERKCDVRELIEEPRISEDGDRVTLTYAIRYGKAHVGEFVLRGVETIDYVEGRIVRMEDIFQDAAALAAWRAKI